MLVAALLFNGASAPEASPLLRWLGANTRVVIGEAATVREREAALRVCDSLAPEDPSSLLLTDAWIAAHRIEAGSHHLVIVGTPQSNGALRDHHSMWWRTAECEDAATFPVRGLYLFGAGDLPGRAAGVIEPVRNPYTIAAAEAPAARGAPLTWVVRCVGRFPEGAAAAVDALLDDGMLSGAVLDSRALKGAAALEVERALLTAQPPSWSTAAELEGLELVGWHQADRLLVDGLTAAMGTRPLALWRLVFRASEGPRDLTANLHRRNTANEVLLCRMADGRVASAAARRLLRSLGDVRESQDGSLLLLDAALAEGTVWAASRGNYLAMESLEAPWDRLAVISVMRDAPP